MQPPHPTPTLFPYTTLFRSQNMTQDGSWPEAQRLQAALSSNGHLTTVAGSGHYIHWDHPSVVIDAVQQVVATEGRSEEHTSELQSRFDLVCRLLLEKKNYIH